MNNLLAALLENIHSVEWDPMLSAEEKKAIRKSLVDEWIEMIKENKAR